jgi:sterol desaturase/sphingolipid hydroxylase (fatty acid hydroxylase superfamily)
MPAAAVEPTEHRFVSNRDTPCRMFRSDLLERLSYVHPAVPHVIYVPVIILSVWQGVADGLAATSLAGLFIAGLVVWTLTEYTIHRFLFHPPQHIEDDTRRVLSHLAKDAPCMAALPTWHHRFYFLVHGVHHDFPSDSRRLVMPPSVSIPLAGLFFVAFRVTLGSLAPAAFAGFIAGYLFYDTTHYLTHHGPARTALRRFQRRRHFRHHYADSTHDYGVSSPLWDLLLGTRGSSADRLPPPGTADAP